MSAPLPLLGKTPFLLDLKPLAEASSPYAGALATSRAFRSLGLPAAIEAALKLKKRQRGFSEAQMIESLVLLQTIGGDCPEDIALLAHDACIARGLGYEVPKVTAIREFLENFHDRQQDELRPPREQQRSFIFPQSAPVGALQQVQSATVGQIAACYEQQGAGLHIATIDQDATIIESHKSAALPHYQGGRGYQPMVALWAEADLVVADEFRDGNVPALQDPLSCARMAFASLPASVHTRYFRADSACYEQQLLNWLSDPQREAEPAGRIGFAISAALNPSLSKALKAVSEELWKTFSKESNGTLRQWAELDYVPSRRYENKANRPLRYVGLRLLQPQGVLFADGSDRHFHAVVTNIEWEGGRLLQWQREKAGSIEHLHDEIKNALGGSHLPSQRFNVNAAWMKVVFLSYNIASAIKGLCFSFEERTARFKRYRLLAVYVNGRMNRNNCVMRLRLCAPEETIARIAKIWQVFALPTHASSMRPRGGRGA
jgi:hypothetical protein